MAKGIMTNTTRNWHVAHQRTIEYEVANCADISNPQNDALLSVGKRENTRRFIIVDANVEKYCSKAIRGYFDFHKIDASILIFPSGEKNKTVDNYLWILGELDKFPINRRDEPIIAIGGGVLTDIAGFVASSYRRGVPHIKVPTTLMGYIDAAVGIKTGVNFNNHKNRLGSFEPPKKVLLDRNFLHGVACITSRFQDEISASILDRSVGGMLEELQPNLFEDELARKVDFGHTFSYGLETQPDTELLHGEAVLIDILIC